MADEEALVYAFGERWGPESNKADKYFGFLLGNGIHDIHMNQGNVGSFIEDDGVWPEGAWRVLYQAAGKSARVDGRFLARPRFIHLITTNWRV